MVREAGPLPALAWGGGGARAGSRPFSFFLQLPQAAGGRSGPPGHLQLAAACGLAHPAHTEAPHHMSEHLKAINYNQA